MIRWLRDVPRKPALVELLILVNFLGSLYGFWWYRHQLIDTTPVFWPVIPDSPLSAYYMAIVLILFRAGRRSQLLEGLAYFGLLKYGLWTMFLISLYWIEYSTFYLEDLWLFVSHFGMALQAVIFFPYLAPRLLFVLVAGGWYLFNDYMDYALGFHPYLPPTGHYALVVAFSLVSTWVILFSLSRWSLGKEKAAGRKNH